MNSYVDAVAFDVPLVSVWGGIVITLLLVVVIMLVAFFVQNGTQGNRRKIIWIFGITISVITLMSAVKVIPQVRDHQAEKEFAQIVTYQMDITNVRAVVENGRVTDFYGTVNTTPVHGSCISQKTPETTRYTCVVLATTMGG